MNKKTLSIGITILIIGMFLSVGFWPIFSVSAEGLADDYDIGNGEIESYEEGDTVLVQGTVTGLDEYPELLGDLFEETISGIPIELDDDFFIILEGQNSTELEKGDEVYGRISIEEELGIEYFLHDGDLNLKQTINLLFYSLSGAGAGVAAVGFWKD